MSAHNPTTAIPTCDLDGTGLCQVHDVNAAQAVSVTYYTDPICSACWAMEPAWRSFQYRYRDIIRVRHVYGGLLRSWEDHVGSGGPRGPADLPHHQEQLALSTGQPIDSSVWTRDPILSSYPPSIAAVAARQVDASCEPAFIRSIREQLFLFGRNIERPETWWTAAEQAGIDVVALRSRIDSGSAEREFLKDVADTRANHVRGFPTVELALDDNRLSFFGPQSYARMESALLSLAGVSRGQDPVSVDEAIDYLGTGTTTEYAELLGLLPAQVERLLRGAGLIGSKLTGGMVWTVPNGR